MIKDLLKHYDIETLRSALILCWAEANSVPFKQLEKSPEAQRFVDAANHRGAAKIKALVQEKYPSISLKQLEGCFESFIEERRRKSQGAVYTPDFVIDCLIANGLSLRPDASKKTGPMCDPACGSGGFLIRAAEIFREHWNISLEKSFSELVSGIDNDPSALKHARCLIHLHLLSNNVHPSKIHLRLACRDTLLSPPEEIWKSTGFGEGFDILATNPPYVKLQNLDAEYREKLTESYPEYTRGSFSSALLFLIAGHRLLSDNGCLAFITQNNLYTSLAGAQVRRFLQKEKCVRRILDFGHHKIFSNATAYTCLVFLNRSRNESFELKSVHENVPSEIMAPGEFSSIEVDRLDSSKWRLAESRHLENLNILESCGEPLGKIADIRVGFATLKDTVFFAICKERGCFAGNNGHFFEIEEEMTKPAVKIADVSREADLDRNKRRIIFPYRKVNGKYVLIPEEEFRICYPLTYRYLSKNKELLKTRDKGGKRYEAWYAWGRRQSMAAPGPKLLTKTFSLRPNFMLDTTDQLFCNGYAVFPKPSTSALPSNVSIAALQKILNSDIMFYYAKLTSFCIGGDYQCYQKNFIEKFHIPRLTSQESEIIETLPQREANEYLASKYRIRPDHICEITRSSAIA